MIVEEKVSVIVPVYNVEKYLRECVDSILSQTYTCFELILVDDGSTDNSGAICDDYAKENRRIKVIHKENGGLSDARNVGIEAANGSYYTFIDSDDCISDNYLELMMECAIKQGVEVVQGINTSDRKMLCAVKKEGYKRYGSAKEVMRDYLLFRDVVGYACNKLYAKRLFEKLRYPVGKIQEDAWTTYKALYEAQGVAVIGVYTYYYRINNASIMNGSFRPQRFDIMRVPDDIRSYLREKEDTYSYQEELNYYTMRIGFKTYNDCIMKGSMKANREKMRELRKTIIAIPPNRELWERKYIVMKYLLLAFPWAYHHMVKSMRKKKGS